MTCCFFVVLWRKSEHKEAEIGYKIRILGQKVQPGIRDLFGNRKNNTILDNVIFFVFFEKFGGYFLHVDFVSAWYACVFEIVMVVELFIYRILAVD